MWIWVQSVVVLEEVTADCLLEYKHDRSLCPNSTSSVDNLVKKINVINPKADEVRQQNTPG